MLSKKKEKGSYYGGDKLDQNDEESQKLYLNDCRQRQAALYSPFLFKSASAQFLLCPPDISELLCASGQGRFHLNLQNTLQKQVTNHTKTSGPKSLAPSSDSSESLEVDLLCCKLKLSPNHPFPKNPISEADMVRAHGFALLIWPQTSSKEEVLKYLDLHYPDCGNWYRELDKVMMWLDQKWRPLARFLGISTAQPNPDSSDPLFDIRIRGLPPDSVASLFIQKRHAQYEDYARLLMSYFQHRLEFSPGFHYSPIHRELTEMSKKRLASISEDAGFINVVGNRLLNAGYDAEAANQIVTLNARQFSSSIADPVTREQCLQTLLPGKILKNKIIKKSKSKKKRIDASIESGDARAIDTSMDMDDQMMSDSSSIASIGEDEALGETNPGAAAYPNRPITKEIMDNRGIIKYRHKRERNPRVHLRHKYHKATVRYRSRVAPNKNEENPYGGEAKGIRVHLVKSHKFK